MAIYEKPVSLLMKDFVREQKIQTGQVIHREQIYRWFQEKFPKIKPATISAHLLRMSVNAQSRIHYNANPNGDDDLFFQIDSGRFRLYDAGKDSQPIYISPGRIGDSDDNPGAPGLDDPAEYQQTGFAYESDLRDFLSRNLSVIEPGLRLYEEEEVTGVEFPAGSRSIDLLAVDRNNNYVVIELKVSRGYDKVIGQLLRYMVWIEKNQAEPGQMVRGVIIAREISEDLRMASSKIPGVQLFEYDLSVSLRRVG